MKKKVFLLVLVMILSFGIAGFCDEPQGDVVIAGEGEAAAEEVKEVDAQLNISSKQGLVEKTIHILGFSDTIGHKINLNDYVTLAKDELRSPYFMIMNSTDFNDQVYSMADYNTVLYVYPDEYGDMSFKIRGYLSEDEFTEFELKLTFKPSYEQWKAEAKNFILPLILALIGLLLVWIFRISAVKLACDEGYVPNGIGFKIANEYYFFSFSRILVEQRIEAGKRKVKDRYYCNYFEIRNSIDKNRSTVYLIDTDNFGKEIRKIVYVK